VSGRSKLGIAALATGLVGAAVVGTVAAERRAVGRAVGRARRLPDPYVDEPLGARHTRAIPVTATDGLRLHVEAEDDPGTGLTVVFVHGFTLSMECWHFQRRDLTDVGRLVFYDQRSHGASGRSDSEHATIDQLGHDLMSVLDVVVPDGPVILVGHSMGGMTILALADQHPELFGDRIVGVALLATSSGKLADTLFGLPGWLGRGLRPVVPGVVHAANRRAALLENGRRAGTDLEFLATRYLSYGPDAPPSLVAFMARMIAGTSVEVMTEFFDTFLSHDKLAALDVLRGIPVLICCGERDSLTPVSHSETMAEALPDAELLIIRGAGHMAIIDRHDEVNDALRRLVDRAAQDAPSAAAS
jgi:pimeloyl-ACP methyl ester carboxylesterase